MKSSSDQQTWHVPLKTSLVTPDSPQNNKAKNNFCPLFDNATFLMLEREESLLGEIVQECTELMNIALEQAEEVADDIEFRL